jgi:hypothetical protein
LDQFIIGIIALLAAGYLFRRIRAMIRQKNACCGCNACGSVRGDHDCSGKPPKIIDGGKKVTEASENR